MTTPEQHFAAFRGTGDAPALAAVFDALAPELLLIAAHVAPAGAEPEDLVQATFLDAIEKAARWDATRPLLPWLIGILVNHARVERRRSARRPDAARATGDAAPRQEPSPLDALAAGEVAEQVARALRGLPRHYRQALTLRLVHGLTPTAIAHALGCPVSTVKARLQRGMEWLRQALPAGIAASLAGIVSTGRGLAAVRALVVAKGALQVQAPAAGWMAGGALLIMKKVAVVAVVAVCGVALWFVAPATTAADGAGAPSAAIAVHDPLRTPLPPAEPPVAARAPHEAPNDERVPVAVAPREGSARLEFVWKPDGGPAADVAVVVSRVPDAPRGGGTVTVQGERHRTDAQGWLPLPVLAAGSYMVSACGVHHSFEVRAGAEARERIELEPGLRLRGTVVDADGRGVAGATVWTSRFTGAQEHEPRAVAQSSADGTFVALVETLGHVWAAKPGHAPSRFHAEGRGELRPVAADDAVRTVTVRLELGAAGCALRGVVRDAGGGPAAGALVTIVRASHQDACDAPLSLQADADGRFASDELAPGEHLLVARAPGHAPATVRFTATPGRQDLEVRLGRGATVHGAVRDAAGTGVQAVVELSAHGGAEPLPLQQLRTMAVVCDVNSGYRVEHVPTGTVRLRVHVREHALEQRLLELADGQVARCDVVLGESGTIRGRVLDPNGRPLQGWNVQASGPGVPRQAESGSDGAFVLRGLADAEHFVSTRPPDALPLPWVGVAGVRPGAGEVVLRAPARDAGGWFAGRVLDAADRPAPTATISIAPVDDPRGVACTTSLEDRDGALRVGPLSPGRYRLRVRVGDGWIDAGTAVLPAGATVDVGTLRLPPSGVLLLRLCLPDGSAVAPAELGLGDAAGNGGAVTERAGADGWRSQPLPAGTYRVRAWGEAFLPLEQDVTLAAGRETPVELHVTPAVPVRLAFPRPKVAGDTATGASRWLAQVMLRVEDAGGHVVAAQLLAVDAEDTFAWARGFAPGSYTYEAKVWPDGAPVRGGFTVPVGARQPLRVEVRLPAAESR